MAGRDSIAGISPGKCSRPSKRTALRRPVYGLDQRGFVTRKTNPLFQQLLQIHISIIAFISIDKKVVGKHENWDMNKWTLLFCIMVISLAMQAQSNLNLELLANANDYPSHQYNDVWGYVDASGTEYAVIGTRAATVIYSLADPTSPEEVAFIPGTFSVWRDYKSFGNYIYGTADQGKDGLLLVDMTNAPQDITWELWKPDITINQVTDTLERCHNLYIDENGYCYLSGCNLNGGGILIVDVSSEPGTPLFVSAADPRYSHDNFTRGDTIWSADINTGVFSVIDVSDKNNPVTLVTQPTSNNFTHNTWISDDGRYLFTTDERANSFVDAYDVSDLDNIRLLDKFTPPNTEDQGVIPHNVHYQGGFLITSWYTEGVIITDASRPANLIQVGNYDTFPGASGGTDGCWGAYPFLPSGLVLATDITTGLYVLQPTYVRACYLEGQVTDAVSGGALDGVKVTILTPQISSTTTDLNGDYGTGMATAGTYPVEFVRAGYNRQIADVTLENGVVTVANVSLVPAETYNITGQVVSAEDGSPIPGASIIIENDLYSYQALTDLDGQFLISNAFEETYDVFGGKWGYRHDSRSSFVLERSENLVLELEEGYQDDFVFDFGWEASTDSASAGFWTRGIPEGTTFFGEPSNPGEDIEGDLGNSCFVTGNRGVSAAFDDVDNGGVTLVSPPFDLTDAESPILRFHYWFFNAGGSAALDDTLKVFLSNGNEEILLEQFGTNTNGWRQSQDYDLAEILPLTSDMTVKFFTSDQVRSGHLVEAAVDGFLILDQADLISSTRRAENTELGVEIYPNPSAEQFLLEIPNGGDKLFEVRVFTASGRQIEHHSGINTLNFGGDWIPGIYWIKVEDEDGHFEVRKVIKH